jgi:FMN phosphatase YigB (HAD superfamily)
MIGVHPEVGYRKPDKRIYNTLSDRIQSPISCCVFVDDSSNNLRPASEIGIKKIRFVRRESNDDFSVDFEISGFTELPQAIKRVFK